jgi:hypothetical protein
MRLSSALLLLLTIFSINSCSTCSGNRLNEMLERSIDSMKAGIEGQRIRDSINTAREAQLNLQIDSITAQDYMENSQATMYILLVNNAWPVTLDLNRNGLEAGVNEELGEIVLMSTLPGIHSPLHNRVEIEIAGKKIEVDTNNSYPLTVPYQPGHRNFIPDPKGEVLFIESEKSMSIVQAIVDHPDEEIKVTTYSNDKVYATYVLSDKDKEAILAAHRLMLLIRERNALKDADVEWDD